MPGCALRSERALPRWIALAGGLALLAGCEIERVGIPATDSRIALHSVLSATASSQVVLLERTRNGTVFILHPQFDVVDPVVSDQGVAESGADVVLTTPSGAVIRAREDNLTRDDRKGAGIYRFDLPGDRLERNGIYHLSVRTASGDTLEATTVVPGGTPATNADTGTFNRTSDTVTVTWPASPGARSYFVRVESPYGPFTLFTDSTHVRLPGLLRNADAARLPRVFIPGFQQEITVSAVDSNFYDWFRTSNGVFTGTGVVNRVTGGIGLFGGLTRLRRLDYQVIASDSAPWAGRYEVVPGMDPPPYLGLELYLESRASRADQPDQVSGRYRVRPRFGYGGCMTCGLLGDIQGHRIRLAFVRDWSARDTVEVLTAEWRGDTIVGSYRNWGATARFVRR